MTSNTTLFNSLLTIEQKYKGAKQIDIQKIADVKYFV